MGLECGGGEAAMIYEANTRQWKLGDHVIHDCDHKDASMLMVVIGYNKEGLVVTVYAGDQKKRRRPEPYTNELRFLHDPKRFGIEVTL